MDIKEQKPNVIKELDDYILVVCNNWSDYDHAIEVKHLITIDEVVAKIQSIYEQAGYVQLQAGEDGLISFEDRVKIGTNNNTTYYCWGNKEIEKLLKAQKSLDESQAKQKQADIVVACDMLITELISYKDGKLTFKDIEPSLQRWNQYRIKAFKKQTLEELEEKE